MVRQKRTYRVLEKAQIRAAGLQSIDPSMDFGGARNLKNYTQIIQDLRIKIDAYNTALSVIDSSKSAMDELQQTLIELGDEMLIGVAYKYGKNSSEYEIAGGVRKNSRSRKRAKTDTVQETSDNKAV